MRRLWEILWSSIACFHGEHRACDGWRHVLGGRCPCRCHKGQPVTCPTCQQEMTR